MARKEYTYHYIYKTVNLVNDKFYIGMHSTYNLEDGYKGSGQRLWHSIKKYGVENFTTEILEFLPDRETLREREKEIVNKDLVGNPLCMNITTGGNGTRYGASFPDRKSSPLSEEHKQHISESSIGKNSGVPKSEEHRKKLAESNTGKVQSEETKKKRSETATKTWKDKDGHTEECKARMSTNRRGKGSGNTPWNKGLHHSPESNQKNAEAHIGKIVSEETKRKISDFWRIRREAST